MSSRVQFSSGSPWEPTVGYCRAVRVGNTIHVAGTTAQKDGVVCCQGDAYGQTKMILDIIREALEGLGAGIMDVVRTRMYVTDISRWEEFGKAHGEVFGEIRPASTMVEVSALINPEMLIEIEAEAIVP